MKPWKHVLYRPLEVKAATGCTAQVQVYTLEEYEKHKQLRL